MLIENITRCLFVYVTTNIDIIDKTLIAHTHTHNVRVLKEKLKMNIKKRNETKQKQTKSNQTDEILTVYRLSTHCLVRFSTFFSTPFPWIHRCLFSHLRA